VPINYIAASGKDIADIVNRIENVVEGEANVHVSVSCIIVACLAQNPSISPEQLQNCVKGVSEYMAANLFDTPEAVN
jgi:hypothetical protein